jgi:HEAT repeat protein
MRAYKDHAFETKSENKMTTPDEIPFQQLLDALLDADNPLPSRYFYHLSDLDDEEIEQLGQVWEKMPAWRRKALMEDIETMEETDYLLSFEAIARLAIRDADPAVRLPAIHTLWDYEDDHLIPVFLDMLEKDEDIQVRAAAATALGKYVFLGEIDELPLDTLRDIEDRLLASTTGKDDTLVRRRALESLGYSGRDEVPPLVEAAYASNDKDWIVSALFAMGRSAHEGWIPLVLDKLENNLPAVRAEAARAAGELEISEATSILIDLLDDPNDDVREASIWSLSQIGGEGVREALENLYEETEDEEEAEFIDDALDNLAFTEETELFTLFDFPDDEFGLDDVMDDELFDLTEDEDDEDLVD